jgi:Protein of unknown function (DUF3108)
MSSRRFSYFVVLVPLALAAILLLARPRQHVIAKHGPGIPAEKLGPGTKPSSTRNDQKPKKTKEPQKEASKPAPVPFAAGETLAYSVSWAAFTTAATIQLSVLERHNLYGWDSWHLCAKGSTENPVRRIFEIDDEFDSYTDASTLASHQYEMYLNELGKTEKNVMELTPQGTVARGAVASVIVPPGTRDPIAFLESMRAWDWEHSSEMRVPVFDGHNLYDVHADREANDEQVSVAAGNFHAAKIAIRIFSAGKEMQQNRFTLWLANSSARTPVAMEAELPFGTFRLELAQITAGKSN